MTVGKISATAGDVEITVPGSIVPANAASLVETAGTITLLAGDGAIGLNSVPLGVLAGRSLAATAGGGRIVLLQATGDMRIKSVAAKSDVRLRTATGSILAASGGTEPVVTGANVFLHAAGSIGVPGQDLVITVAPGSSLTATAGRGVQIEQAGGDLAVATATTTTGGVRLTVPAGSLTLPDRAALWSSAGPVLLQVRDSVTLAPGSIPRATTWFAIVGRYGRTGEASAINASSGGSSVITAPYRSVSQWVAAESGPASQATSGYADAAKTTLKTLGTGASASAVATDTEGNIYFFNPATHSLKQIDWTGSIRTLLSSGLHNVRGLAVDVSGNVIIADAVPPAPGRTSAIRRWNATTGTLSTIVSTSSAPAGVAVDASGNIFFTAGNAVKKWAAATGTVSSLPFTQLNAPTGVATDAAGNVYVVDTGNNKIKKWNASTDKATHLSAFTGLRNPRGIAVADDGDILVADTGNNRIKIWDSTLQTVTPLIKTGLTSPSQLAIDGRGTVATINTVGYSSTLDVFQPWADVPTSRLAVNAAGTTAALPAVVSSTQPLYGPFVPKSDVPWLHVTGSTDGAVQFTVDRAPTGNLRTGHLTILGRKVAISQAAGQTTTAINGRTVAYGANGMVWVTVRSTHATPTGPVSLRVDGGPALTSTLVAAGTSTAAGITTHSAAATFNVGLLRGGAHKLVATYADQATFTGSSATGEIEVTRAAVTPTLSQAANTIVFGASASFTARLIAVAGGAMPTGYVQFYRESTQIGAIVKVDDNGQVRLVTTDLPRGTHRITARYLGDGNYSPATSAQIWMAVR